MELRDQCSAAIDKVAKHVELLTTSLYGGERLGSGAYVTLGSSPTPYATLVVDYEDETKPFLRKSIAPGNEIAMIWFEACMHEIAHFVAFDEDNDEDLFSQIESEEGEDECYYISLALVKEHAPELLQEYVECLLSSGILTDLENQKLTETYTKERK